jgi:hypothetical protein
LFRCPTGLKNFSSSGLTLLFIGWAGFLFAGRYKALLVDGSGNVYLKTVCDYAHLNPVRAADDAASGGSRGPGMEGGAARLVPWREGVSERVAGADG